MGAMEATTPKFLTSPAEGVVRRLLVLEATVLGGVALLVVFMLRLSFLHGGSFQDLINDPTLPRTLLLTAEMCLPTAAVVALASYGIAYYCYVYVPKIAYGILLPFVAMYIVSYYAILLGWRSIWDITRSHSSVYAVSLLEEWIGSGGGAAMCTMTLRYLPIGILLLYLRMSALPSSKVLAAYNHGVSKWRIHWKLMRHWCGTVLLMVFSFTLILSSLDHLAMGVAGSGKVQTLALLIDDWQRADTFKGSCFLLGLFYILVSVIIIWLSAKGIADSPLITGAKGQTVRFQRAGLEHFILLGIALLALSLEVLTLSGVLYLALGGGGVFPTLIGVYDLWNDPRLMEALTLSLKISIPAAVISVVLAMVSTAAMHIRNNLTPVERRKPYSFGLILMSLPFVIPPLLQGIAAGEAQGHLLGLYGSWYSILLAHVVVFSPLAYFVTVGGLGILPSNCYLAARNLNLPLRAYLLRVYLRACWPAGAVAGLLVFAFSLNDPILAKYVGGNEHPLSVEVADQKISALGMKHYWAILLMLVLTLVVLGVGVSLLKSLTLWRRRRRP